MRVLAIMRQNRAAVEAYTCGGKDPGEEFTGRIFRSSYRKARKLTKALDEKMPGYIHYIEAIYTE